MTLAELKTGDMAEILGYPMMNAHYRAPGWLIAIVANGAGTAIQTVMTFLPPVGFMFLALSVLEDSGYMARAAFVMDRFMRWIGLPGRSFVPMLVGFGCSVPAIMVSGSVIWLAVGSGLIAAMFGGFGAYGRRHRVDMI